MKVWDSQLGWLVPELKKGVVIGEWGAKMKGKSATVQNDLAKYLVDNCMYNNVWWAMNPDSGDTGGLMSWNWDSYDRSRLDVPSKMIPDPSAFGIQHNKLCFHQGTWPNADCALVDSEIVSDAPAAGAADATAPATPAVAIAKPIVPAVQ